MTQLSSSPVAETDDDPRDPLALAADAPLLAAWLATRTAVEAGRFTPFTIPGHKHRQDLLGELVRGDLPLHGALAPVKAADDLLHRAERRAAEQFGADWCRFSVGGSTHGNQALALAVGRPGQKVIVSRTLHRSLLRALVMADLVPIWIRPRIHPGTGLPLGVEAATVREALQAHPDACAVMLTDPSYIGTCGDVPAIAEVAHAAGVPLVLDAAWGAHFGAHPALPPLPLVAGADAVVTSAHRTLPATTQAAMVLARTSAGGGLLDADRLDRGFEAGHTTSPSGTVLAGLDAVRALLAARGTALVGDLLVVVARARRRLAAVPGVTVLDAATEGLARLDPTTLVVHLAGTGAHGDDVEADLIAAGMPPEMADRDTVIPMITMADPADRVEALVTTMIEAIERHRGAARQVSVPAAWTTPGESVMSPRAAFFADHETVPWQAAAGRVCAEVLAPYPPGVPVLAPGELITADALEALAATAAEGGRVAYAADPTLASVRVVGAR